MVRSYCRTLTFNFSKHKGMDICEQELMMYPDSRLALLKTEYDISIVIRHMTSSQLLQIFHTYCS